MTSKPRHRWPRVLAAIASCLVMVGTALAGLGGYLANSLALNIQIGDDGNFVSTAESRVQPGAPINILLMGSDTRSNGNGHGRVADIAGARSDTTILLHISGDRQRALAVSIPRDSKIQLPTCKTKSGSYDGGYTSRFNEAFDIGGPGCTVKAVQQLTGVSIDHYLVVDFNGFKSVVNAMDGVEICLKKSVNDPKSKLNLKAGKQVVKGEDALAFVRARYNLGDGSDIGRIDRQQEFLSSAIRKATSLEVLTNPAKLYRVLQAGTKSLKADKGLASLESLKELALNVSEVKPDNIVFATVPWTLNSGGGTVTWIPSQASDLFSAIKDDREWPPPPTQGPDGKPLTAAPATISVNVLNGTGKSGAGIRAADALRAQGYNVVKVGNAKQNVDTTTVTYYENDAGLNKTRTLAYATGADIVPSTKKTPVLTLTVGPDFMTVKPVLTAKAKKPNDTAKPRTAAEKICSS